MWLLQPLVSAYNALGDKGGLIICWLALCIWFCRWLNLHLLWPLAASIDYVAWKCLVFIAHAKKPYWEDPPTSTPLPKPQPIPIPTRRPTPPPIPREFETQSERAEREEREVRQAVAFRVRIARERAEAERAAKRELELKRESQERDFEEYMQEVEARNEQELRDGTRGPAYTDHRQFEVFGRWQHTPTQLAVATQEETYQYPLQQAVNIPQQQFDLGPPTVPQQEQHVFDVPQRLQQPQQLAAVSSVTGLSADVDLSQYFPFRRENLESPMPPRYVPQQSPPREMPAPFQPQEAAPFFHAGGFESQVEMSDAHHQHFPGELPSAPPQPQPQQIAPFAATPGAGLSLAERTFTLARGPGDWPQPPQQEQEQPAFLPPAMPDVEQSAVVEPPQPQSFPRDPPQQAQQLQEYPLSAAPDDTWMMPTPGAFPQEPPREAPAAPPAPPASAPAPLPPPPTNARPIAPPPAPFSQPPPGELPKTLQKTPLYRLAAQARRQSVDTEHVLNDMANIQLNPPRIVTAPPAAPRSSQVAPTTRLVSVQTQDDVDDMADMFQSMASVKPNAPEPPNPLPSMKSFRAIVQIQQWLRADCAEWQPLWLDWPSPEGGDIALWKSFCQSSRGGTYLRNLKRHLEWTLEWLEKIPMRVKTTIPMTPQQKLAELADAELYDELERMSLWLEYGHPIQPQAQDLTAALSALRAIIRYFPAETDDEQGDNMDDGGDDGNDDSKGDGADDGMVDGENGNNDSKGDRANDDMDEGGNNSEEDAEHESLDEDLNDAPPEHQDAQNQPQEEEPEAEEENELMTKDKIGAKFLIDMWMNEMHAARSFLESVKANNGTADAWDQLQRKASGVRFFNNFYKHFNWIWERETAPDHVIEKSQKLDEDDMESLGLRGDSFVDLLIFVEEGNSYVEEDEKIVPLVKLLEQWESRFGNPPPTDY